MTRTHVRIRVHEAVEAAVRDAADLAERSNADGETRLRMVVDGWGRGLAAALEELAVSLDELWRLTAPSDPEPEQAPAPPPALSRAEPAAESPPPATDETEEQLRARAAASRAETKALGEEKP
jgi:hypothetical protein